MFRFFGNTPGKALLGISVVTVDGKVPGFAKYCSRNLSLWVTAFALGIPIVNLILMARQAKRLAKGRRATYDEPSPEEPTSGYEVRRQPTSVVRVGVFTLASICLLVLFGFLNRYQPSHQPHPDTTVISRSYVWQNPLTGGSASISQGWKYSSISDKSQRGVYVFTSDDDNIVVLFAAEELQNLNISDYVEAFEKSNLAKMRFSGGGVFTQIDGHDSWQGSGNVIAEADNTLTVFIVKYALLFWRIVIIQAIPPGHQVADVPALRSALWNTLNDGP